MVYHYQSSIESRLILFYMVLTSSYSDSITGYHSNHTHLNELIADSTMADVILDCLGVCPAVIYNYLLNYRFRIFSSL